MDIIRSLSYVRRACQQYDLIDDNDRIAIGLSGGKDSMVLLKTLSELRRFYPKRFDIAAITVDLGIPGMSFDIIKEYCDTIGVEYHIVKTDIYKIVFEIRKESNPCSLCSKMRRGAIYNAALDLGIRKVAYAHHNDDVVETFLMNLMNEGRIGTFSPKTYLDRTGVTLIRPLVLMPESYIKSIAEHEQLPVVKSTCPSDTNSKRYETEKLIRLLEKENRDFKAKIFGAICRSGIDGFFEEVN